ncbi:MAG TPA: EscU/YscU/HrcU family type III secretion system export apparatus switch protein [Candidatus Eremiobacteraceae bacterium]|nr:EscU/YscU/HrcU family type III secretion system export apparatus switch protein [Candidatus Eremiobacteraceae bacterium]
MSHGERTEAPTPKRLAKTRAEGRWAHSTYASAALLALISALPAWAATQLVASWSDLSRETALMAVRMHNENLSPLVLTGAWLRWKTGWLIVTAAWAAACVAATASSAASGALGISFAALRPRLDRLSWASGLRQLVGSDGAYSVALAMSATIAVGWAAWPAARDLMALAATRSLQAMLAGFNAALFHAWSHVCSVLFIFALIDVVRTRGRMMRMLRMSTHEVREERAEMEGRPETRARRRASAKSVRDVRVGAIRKATAVIANPTHVAVALRYAPPQIDVPVVVSRGADLAAILVRSVAALNDIPVIESPQLARTLYARAALGEPIPEESYAAVAAIFALLIQTRGRLLGDERE